MISCAPPLIVSTSKAQKGGLYTICLLRNRRRVSLYKLFQNSIRLGNGVRDSVLTLIFLLCGSSISKYNNKTDGLP